MNIAIRSSVNKEPIFRTNSILSFQLIHEDEVWEPFLLESEFEPIEAPRKENLFSS